MNSQSRDVIEQALAQQIDYYRERAAEYDEWWLRQGRYDRGQADNARWRDEGTVVEQALAEFAPRGRVLELACGTGLWTQRLAAEADHVTAVDAAPEALAVARERLARTTNVDLVQADIFSWKPDGAYDAVFFSFWLSHVPPDQLTSFWELVRACLAPGGRVFFADSRKSQTASSPDQDPEIPGTSTSLRRLNDGREFSIVKVFYDPIELTDRLDALGWDADVRVTDEYFIYGSARPR